MTEQQQHLISLLEQRNNLEKQISQNKELFWKVQGAIEYLAQIGVTVPESNDGDGEGESINQEEE
jgi:hypothetical protein